MISCIGHALTQTKSNSLIPQTFSCLKEREWRVEKTSKPDLLVIRLILLVHGKDGQMIVSPLSQDVSGGEVAAEDLQQDPHYLKD